jgi:hypothetical protein
MQLGNARIRDVVGQSKTPTLLSDSTIILRGRYNYQKPYPSSIDPCIDNQFYNISCSRFSLVRCIVV